MTETAGARDLVWDSLVKAAAKLDEQGAADDRWGERERVSVQAKRTRSLLRWRVSEGLEFGNLWTYGYEEVRDRRLFSHRWKNRQSSEQAASSVGAFLRDRRDAAGTAQ